MGDGLTLPFTTTAEHIYSSQIKEQADFRGIKNIKDSPESSEDEAKSTKADLTPSPKEDERRLVEGLRMNTEITLSEHFSENQIREITAFSGPKIKKLTSDQKLSSIARYLDKKNKRNTVSQIRYKIRQDLASKRLRVKGKFVKNKRVDMRLVANQLMIG